jgi:hypothetical protein
MEGEVVSVGQARGFEESYQACYGRLLRQVALVTTDLADAVDLGPQSVTAVGNC